jgi:hypothetical protein
VGYLYCTAYYCTVQPVAGDKKAGKRPTPSFFREFLRFPREPPSVS